MQIRFRFAQICKVFITMLMQLGVILSTFGAASLPVAQAQESASDIQGTSLEVTSTIPIPIEISTSVAETLRSRPANILPGDRLIITSLDQSSGWAIMTVAVQPEDPNSVNSILLNSTIVIAKSDSDGWISAIFGTDAYEILLASAPSALVPAESISSLSAKEVNLPYAEVISTSLRWPWASNARWTMTQKPHSWYGAGGGTDTSAIDFKSLDGNTGVYAAAQGTIIRRCEDNIQHEVVIRHSTGTSNDNVTGYLHLDKNSPNMPAVGSTINAGAYIGNYYNGPIPKGTKCGWGTGGHLHFWIATLPTSVSNNFPPISSFSLSNMYGQTISGWQMLNQNNESCFFKGSDKICAYVPIPGDGSAPGPRPPSNLSATAISSSQINLSWSGSPDSVDGYRVWSGGAIVANQVTSTSYSFSGLSSCSTYSFYVTAYKGDLPSSASNTASAKTSGCLSGAPSAPSLNSPSNGQVFPRFGDINLVWNSNGSYRYLVEFWGGPDGGKSNLGWQSGTSLFFGNGNWGGNYSWHVKAQNSSGQSSDWGETRTFFKKYGTPGNVGVSALSDTQARLTWSPSADAPGNIEGYKIYRDGQLRAVMGSGSTSYDDYDLNCNSSYSYYVKAYKGSGESDVSNTVSVTTNGCPPPAPSAEFDAWPLSGTAPFTTAMHIVNMSNITSCSWNYGDGQTSTTCTQLHNHTYNNAGTYTVTLNVSGPGGSDGMTRTNYITVSSSSTFALTVTKSGTGTGTVTSNPAGINCGSDCSEAYPNNTSVTLTATPATGSSFTGWSDACSGAGSCTVSMTAARSVTATFTTQTSAQPDLIIQSITASPTNPSVNQQVTFTVRIKNQGSADISSSFFVDFFIDNQPGSCPDDGIVWWTVNSLAAGATLDLVYMYDGFSASGTHNVYAFADSYCYISESNENNNISGPVTVNVKLDKDTVGVFRPSNGLLYLKNSNTTGYADVAINYGMGGDYPVVGDWDGDGDATIGIYRNGTFYLRNSNTVGYADFYFGFGSPGDQPVAGDWNNDGIDTIGVYRSSNFTFYLRNSNTAGAPQMTFSLGIPGDVGIAGDWDGDGLDTTGVFRPSNGVIYLKNTNDTGYADIAINYGIGGDKPVTGDWNNDGIDTIGVLRGNTFYLRNTNTVGYADVWFALGIPGDMPIAGNWDGVP